VVGLDQRGGGAAPVVEVAVVGVDGVLQAGDAVEGVGGAVEVGARIAEAVERAGGKGGVEAALQLALAEGKRVRGVGPGEGQTGRTPQAQSSDE